MEKKKKGGRKVDEHMKERERKRGKPDLWMK